jgi:hypothetical protein
VPSITERSQRQDFRQERAAVTAERKIIEAVDLTVMDLREEAF